MVVSGILPMIDTFGILNVYVLVGVASWLAFGCVSISLDVALILTCTRFIWAVIRYGDRMREYTDIGFSNHMNN